MSRRALVVDDSRATRALLKRLLVGCDFETAEAGNGIEGLERLQEIGAVDLCLVDWNMPQMDGLQFIQEVRKISEYERMILMMVTSENEPAYIARALKAGADEYAMKPLTREGLLEKLELIGFGVSES